MQVKGLEIPAWSPAAFSGMGLMYVVGDRGGDHLLLTPPYIITEQQIDELASILDKSIEAVERKYPG